MNIKPILLLLMCGLMAGCATEGRDRFSCPPPKGAGCKSIAEIDAMLDKKSEGQRMSQPVLYHHGPERTQEKMAKVWVAPKVDEAGVYHPGYHLTMVAEPASWTLKAVGE